MKSEDLSSYFLNKSDGKIYQMVAYCAQPTVTLERVEDRHRYTVTVGSALAQDYIKLVPENRGKEI